MTSEQPQPDGQREGHLDARIAPAGQVIPARTALLQPPQKQPRAAASRWAVSRFLAGGLRVLLVVGTAWLFTVFITMILYTRVDPPFSMLTLAAHLSGAKVQQTWVPLGRISPFLVRAVIVSEDAHFCQHSGVSIAEIEKAVEQAKDGVPRGASTISMQVTKNLYLWPHRSYVRKAIEIPLTLALEQVMSKPRIFEIYLNIAEWGPGIFGIEAAARHHFRKPAARLTEAESALLAVTLPNPAARNPGRPGPGLRRLAAGIEQRMRGSPRAAGCIVD